MENGSLQGFVENSVFVASVMMFINLDALIVTTRNPTATTIFVWFIVEGLALVAMTVSSTLATVWLVVTKNHLGFVAMIWFGLIGVFLILPLGASELVFGHPFIML